MSAEANTVNTCIFSGSMAAQFSGQRKQQKKFSLEQLWADDSDFGPDLYSDNDSDELYEPHERDGDEFSA